MSRTETIVIACDQEPPEKPKRGDFATVRFSLDGVLYETELCSKHGKAFIAMATVYTEHARKVTASRASGRAPGTSVNGQPATRTLADRAQSRQMRAWLVDHGRQVPLRGRIPVAEVEYYQANAGNGAGQAAGNGAQPPAATFQEPATV